MGLKTTHMDTLFCRRNAIVTKLLGNDACEMAVERLQNAADLELIKDSSRKKALSRIRVKSLIPEQGIIFQQG
jgi:hypothetical protein